MMEGLVRDDVPRCAVDVDLPDPFPIMSLRRRDARLRLGQARPARPAQADRADRPDEGRRLQGVPQRSRPAERTRRGAARARRRRADAQGDRRLHGVRRRSTARRGSPTSRSTTHRSPTRKGCSRRSSSSWRPTALRAIIERTGARHRRPALLRRRPREGRQRRAGRAARARSAIERGLAEAGWRPLWVVDFPMFEYDDETKARGRRATIRSPRPRTVTRNCSRLTAAHALAKAYDVVLNGWEIGGGSVRIHRPEVQAQRVRGAGDQRRGPAAQVRLPARCAALRRTAARRHRLRARPHRDADVRRRVDTRRHRVPEDAARPGPAGRRADGRSPSSSCATCTSACGPPTRSSRPRPDSAAAGERRRRRSADGPEQPGCAVGGQVRCGGVGAAGPALHLRPCHPGRPSPVVAAARSRWPRSRSASSLPRSRRRPASIPPRARSRSTSCRPEARDTLARIHSGGPFRFERDGIAFGNRERSLPLRESRLLSRVHGRDAGAAHPRRAAHHLRRAAPCTRRLLVHRRSLPDVPEDPRMKLPDLTQCENAGVIEYHGHSDTVAAAATPGPAALPRRRPRARGGQGRAVRRARPRSQAARAFRQQLRRAGRLARGPRLARQDRLRHRTCATRRTFARTIRTTGRPSRRSWRRLRRSGASGTSVLGARQASACRDALVQATRSRCWSSSIRRDLRVLLLERADFPGHWQSRDGQPRRRRGAGDDGDARARRRDRHRRRTLRRRRRLAAVERVRDLSAMAPPLSPGNDAQHRARLRARRRCTGDVSRSRRANICATLWLPWQEAAARCFSWSNRDAILALPQRIARTVGTG